MMDRRVGLARRASEFWEAYSITASAPATQRLCMTEFEAQEALDSGAVWVIGWDSVEKKAECEEEKIGYESRV